jgi:colanic acid/amylovoran biosynthesis glycosyltransferase
MKIALIVGSFPALSLTFVLNQIVCLLKSGHEVDIYAKKSRADLTVHSDIKTYNLLQHTHYWDVPSNEGFRLSKAFQLLASNFHKNPTGILQSLNFFKFGKESLSLRLFYQVNIFSIQKKYDIIFCHFGNFGKLGLLMKQLKALEGKLVTTFHGFDLSQELLRLGNNIYEELFQEGDLFLPISKAWKNKLVDLGCPPEKIIIHKMGIDFKKFIFLPKKALDKNKIKFLTVARLTEKKGIKYGICAIKKLLAQGYNIEYNIVGSGELEQELQILINQLKVEKNIKLLGGKNQENIIELMKNSDILLAPSVTSATGDCEGIPVVLMEALAIGIPVISTYHSSIPELIKNNETGFLVPEKDPNAISDKIQYLINNWNIVSTVTKNGHNFVKQHHDINQLNEQLIQIFIQLINNDFYDFNFIEKKYLNTSK